MVKVQGHGQGPRPWSRSKAMVKVSADQKQSSCLRGRQRRAAGGRALWGKPRFFSVSSNPGRGGKNRLNT